MVLTKISLVIPSGIINVMQENCPTAGVCARRGAAALQRVCPFGVLRSMGGIAQHPGARPGRDNAILMELTSSHRNCLKTRTPSLRAAVPPRWHRRSLSGFGCITLALGQCQGYPDDRAGGCVRRLRGLDFAFLRKTDFASIEKLHPEKSKSES